MLCRAVTRAFLLENGALYDGLYGHIYYCKRLLGFINLSKISSSSMNSGPFASNHTSKVAHSPCALAPLSMVQQFGAAEEQSAIIDILNPSPRGYPDSSAGRIPHSHLVHRQRRPYSRASWAQARRPRIGHLRPAGPRAQRCTSGNLLIRVWFLKPTRRGRFLQKGGFSPATALPPYLRCTLS
jgi:hypothetical protein